MNREIEFKTINEELSKLKVVIENENKINLTDKNIFLEDIMCQIINIMFDYNLKNTNFNISNYPAIDLVDEKEQIAFQITTNINHKKIQSTLDKFFENNYDKEINKIKILVFQNTNYKGAFNVKDSFEFDLKEDIITFDKLIKLIKELDDIKLKELYDFIKIALVDRIYTTDWMIQNTEKSLNNLGKRYNKKLNAFNDEEEKLDFFLVEKDSKKKILDIIIDLIINFENNKISTDLKIDDIINNFCFESTEKLIEKCEAYKNEIFQTNMQYYEKIKFESECNKKINKIKLIYEIINKKVLIYVGEAGIGKSHTLANFTYEYYLKNNQPVLFILGQDFAYSDNIELQISKNLSVKENFNKICEYINNIAIVRDIYIPIIIDGINESKDKSIWKKGLINLTDTILKYSNLKLVISLRKTYYDKCIPKEIEDWDKIKILNHNGFGERNFEAIEQFFNFYNIPIPVTQIINNEFNNPLFLSIYCEIVSKYNIDVDKFQYNNFIDIYNEYLEKVNEKIIEKYEIDTCKNIVKDCLNAIIKENIDKNNEKTYEENLIAIKEIADLYDIRKTELLNELINNGILYKEILNEKEILNFTYERYEKISKAQYLLKDIKNIEELKEKINKDKLNEYFHESKVFDKGILEELLIIIPMTYKTDIFDIIDTSKISFKYYIESTYIESLVWFKNYYDVNIVLEKLKEFMKKDYDNYIITTLIKSSYIQDNPCNINLIHNYLIKLNMVQIDYEWTIVIENYYENVNKQIIDNLINYCLTYGNKYLNNETIYLISKFLSWLLSSNNRGLRDRSTKALVKILRNENSIIIKLLNDFKEVKDLYILERIVATIYGTIIRSKNNENIKELAINLYDMVYRRNQTLDNIIIKIYAKKIFRYLKNNFGINLYDEIKKEKKTTWYEQLPSNNEIDEQYSFNAEEIEEENSRLSNLKIIHSMTTEYGRGISNYGDFGRYTLQLMLNPFEEYFKDIQLLANIATKRVFEYGYDYKLFGNYDNAIKMNQGYSRDYVERIGKKYQWIATYELLSKLYDNYIPLYKLYDDDIIEFDKRKYYDKEYKETKDICKVKYVCYELDEVYPNLLYLDTTNFILRQNNDHEYISEKDFNFDKEEDYSKYIIKIFDDEKYISLFTLQTKENRNISAKTINRVSFTISQTAFIYKNKDKLQKSNFHEFSQGRYIEYTGIDLFEIPFSNKYILESSYNNDYYNINKGYKICYQEYMCEPNKDKSIEDVIRFELPAKWIVDKFNLIQKEEGKWYKGNDLVCFDSIVLGEERGLWIKADYIINYLKENNLKIGWTIYSEKTINKLNNSWRTDIYIDNNMKNFKKENYDYENWESSF